MGWFGKKTESPKEPKGTLVTLRVEGMTCANCVRHVGDALRAVEGIHSADVDLKKGEARVDLDPSRVEIGVLVKAVKGVGYEARVV